jgi:dynein heavy chain, axonemal
LDTLFKSLATFCGNTHTYVHTLSQKLRNELQRTYYVTPTIYIDLVTGYQQLLAQKQHELGSEVEKLSQGLQKLDEAAESSETLQKLLGVNQVELSKKSKDCEDLMIKIENDTINANES